MDITTFTQLPNKAFCASAIIIAACSVVLASSAATIAAQPDMEMQVSETEVAKVREMLRIYGISSAPKTQGDSFRLTTYNIENLFDSHDDPSLTGRNDDSEATKPKHELVATAMAIREVNADVLCIQEVESEAALIEYRDTYLADMGYDHVASIDAGNDRGIENSVLSRFPISQIKNWPLMPLGGVHPEKYGNKTNWYAGEPIVFRRSPLMVDLQIPSTNEQDSWIMTVFVVHHKSGQYNSYWREAESVGVLKLIDEVLKSDPDRPIVVLGDFNAQPQDKSVQTYLDAGFVDLFSDRPRSDEIMTHESNRRIDLILANPNALSKMDLANAFVYGTAARPEGVSWRDLETFEGYAADHYPVSVDISRD